MKTEHQINLGLLIFDPISIGDFWVTLYTEIEAIACFVVLGMKVLMYVLSVILRTKYISITFCCTAIETFFTSI